MTRKPATSTNYFIHSDPRRENLICNSKTDEWFVLSNALVIYTELYHSFIIDLGDAEQWEGLIEDDVCLDPQEELGYWGLVEGRPTGTLFHQKNELIVYMKTEYPVVD